NFSYIRVPIISYYVKTIMISKIRIQDHLDLYVRWGIPKYFNSKIKYILNGIALPDIKPQAKKYSAPPIKILYVGRGTEEKRVDLLAEIIYHLITVGIPVKATFIGDVKRFIPTLYWDYIQFPGIINDLDILDTYYREFDILLMASTTEGFPLSIMEAMARGCVILSTAVGDISLHVIHTKNGFIFSDYRNKKLIIQEAIDYIKQLIKEPELIEKISKTNIDYAYEHYGMNTFSEKYRNIFEPYMNK
ncbi:MAG: glycosyltransferase family 4 protein, partial [Chitinophagaceae bacterium]